MHVGRAHESSFFHTAIVELDARLLAVLFVVARCGVVSASQETFLQITTIHFRVLDMRAFWTIYSFWVTC